MVWVAVKGRIGGWVQVGVNGMVCHCVGASLGEWVCDLASRCMHSAAVFQCGLSCLCPCVLQASLWPRVDTWGRCPWGAGL